MGVAGALGGFDSSAVEFGGAWELPELFERLAAVEIGRAVVGVIGDHGPEFGHCRSRKPHLKV